jgi:hypothetical protein
MGFWVLGWVVILIGLYIYIYLYFFGRAGIHPTKIPKSAIRPLSEYLKYPYPYPSVYILMDRRAGERVDRICRAGRVSWFFAHP